MADNANVRSDAVDAASKPTILIVDDDREQAQQIGTFLAKFGMEVLVEDNGFAAVNTIRRVQPAVVLMDVRMPGLDGIKAAQLTSSLQSDAKIILMSGYADQIKRASEDEELDVFAVVDKPLALRVLVRFIQAALHDRN
ncbi:MAG: response regulator [Alphaproteobacteria bacterium]|nr:response regulator [Alphaproteobacteria bacterium]